MVMACPIKPPVDDSAVASRQDRSRSSSPSRLARGSRSASWGAAAKLTGASSVVGELERHRVVEGAQVRDDPLQLVLGLARDADRVALDHRFHLRKPVADALGQLLGLFRGQSPLQLDPLAHRAPGGRLELPPLEDLERQAATDRLGLDQIADGLGTELDVGGQGNLGLAELKGAAAPLEVIARRDLAPHLVERIHQLLLVEVAHHVKARFAGHSSPLSLLSVSARLRFWISLPYLHPADGPR